MPKRTAALLLMLPLLLATAWDQGLSSEETARADQVVVQALAEAGSDIPAQAELLARLAWDNDDAEVAAAARSMLVDYKAHGIPAMRAAIRWVEPELQGDVVAALIESRDRIEAGRPEEFLVALDEAIWFGTREARRLAIPQAARFGLRSTLLPMVDAALEDPELVPITVRALAIMRDERARFFLEEQLLHGEGKLRYDAALALARIGNQAVEPLRRGLQSDVEEVRLAAVQALLPIATLQDLSALYEYYGDHPDDDPQTRERVRETAARLEQLLQAQQAADAASAEPEN